MNQNPIHVLLVEDNPVDARIPQALDKEKTGNFQITHVSLLQEALRLLQTETFEAILLDLSLPDSEGLETLQAVHKTAPEIPVVIISSSTDEALAVMAVKSGAQDYLVKGEVTPYLLSRAVRYAIERQWIQSMMSSLLFVDELTGLYNRRGFSALAEQQMKLARRTGREVVLLFADLDGLKEINDTLGHPVGDIALKEAAEVLRWTFRESDVLARAGGDEFTVLAIDASGDSLQAIKERLIENVKAMNAKPGRKFQLSLSLGGSRYDSKSTFTVEELLARADEAMYAHKKSTKKP